MSKVATKTAKAFIKESSEEAIKATLSALFSSLNTDDLLEQLTQIFLLLGKDREALKQRLADLLAKQFGRSSERLSPKQLELFARTVRRLAGEEIEQNAEASSTTIKEQAAQILDETHAEVNALVAKKKEDAKAARAKQREERRQETQNTDDSPSWPPHLPVRTHTESIPSEDRLCDDCDAPRAILRYTTSWRLEYTTTCEVVLTRIPVVACKSHHGGPRVAPVAPKPVDKGRMGFSLAARILYWRYTQNLPVRRIVEMLAVDHMPVSEEMIHTLIRTSARRLQPVVNAIAHEVRAANLVNLDDTPVLVLNGYPDLKEKRRRRRARVWLALGDAEWAWFFATKTWEANEAADTLGKITGVIQGDGYAGYPTFAKKHKIPLAGCMAHLRRKFLKADKAGDPRASEPMALVQGLYRVEELARLRGLGPDELLALRQTRAVPLMQALKRWAQEVASSIVNKSPLAKAWTYLQNQWSALNLYLSNPDVTIDNNAAERGLRRITIGRKLWLFFQGQDNAKNAAAIASVVVTARLKGADELAYLTWLLREVARREWSDGAARRLLPDVWLSAQDEQLEELSGHI